MAEIKTVKDYWNTQPVYDYKERTDYKIETRVKCDKKWVSTYSYKY